jgi:GH24 family phage-related lysozyme (muramidase)
MSFMTKARILMFGYSERELQGFRDQQAVYLLAQSRPVAEPAPSEPEKIPLTPVKNWSHPFRDKQHSLHQLTHLSKAAAGFYPLGKNGLWHGGVHFDDGTAGTVDQSSVHCLADGEVVAYRIDRHSPTTPYICNRSPVLRPFSCNFVLVRHRIQPPKIDGSPDTPPSLTVYSLYMHLQDWAVYEADPATARPEFWPEGATRQVKATTTDPKRGDPEQLGLNVRHLAERGKVIGFLPRGAPVSVSGDGAFRKLENTHGPDSLKNADGSLKGYVAFSYLTPIGSGEYRVVTQKGPLTVRASASYLSEAVGALEHGTEVTLSGEGDYRKLERINQYVHFASLQGAKVPQLDQVVVLDQPVPIKAGDLIGHIGLYQDSHDEQPGKRLHLEVFSSDDMEAFLAASRAWAQRLPTSSKTSLKLVRGTPVIAHQERFNNKQPPTLKAASTPSDADLLVPKSLLDGLRAEQKINVPATADSKACNWYRLEGLLHDADNNVLDGWVREEIDVTPWVSPWSWNGYDAVYSYDGPLLLISSYLRTLGCLNEAQLERYGALADMGDTGPLKSRLHDIFDRNRDGIITGNEVQAALSLPAHAQSIAQLIIHSESEWRYNALKWDDLDGPHGHCGSTPNTNWLAEKTRIKEICWWGDVAEKLGLPEDGKVYHFHPIGLVGFLKPVCRDECNVEIFELDTTHGLVRISKEAFDYILETEAYRAYPYVPGGNSGVTIGYGYDLGHQTLTQVRNDLSGLYSPQHMSNLVSTIGRQGTEAREVLHTVSTVSISKEHALMLALRMKQRYAQLMTDAYPEIVDLHPHCQGALLSLVVNRGNSLQSNKNDSRLEMKMISEDLIGGQPENVPARLRSMKRLWEGKPGLRGLLTRRENEAKLFERGLQCEC